MVILHHTQEYYTYHALHYGERKPSRAQESLDPPVRSLGLCMTGTVASMSSTVMGDCCHCVEPILYVPARPGNKYITILLTLVNYRIEKFVKTSYVLFFFTWTMLYVIFKNILLIGRQPALMWELTGPCRGNTGQVAAMCERRGQYVVLVRTHSTYHFATASYISLNTYP